MKLQIKTDSAEKTIAFAQKLGQSFALPTVISLVGDLGAGKTTFVKGLAEGLEIKDNITSPTFTLLNEYTNARLPLYHFDFYRIENAGELAELGFETYFDDLSLKGITVVEWASNAPELLPKNYLQITFEKLGDNERLITLKGVVK